MPKPKIFDGNVVIKGVCSADSFVGTVASGTTNHHTLSNLTTYDDHTQYVRADGGRGFTAPVSGVAPVSGCHLVTKSYADTTYAPSGSTTGNATSLQGRSLSSTAPTNQQGIIWNSGASQWQPTTIDHNSLSGISLDSAHPQYLLAAGDVMNGMLELSGCPIYVHKTSGVSADIPRVYFGHDISGVNYNIFQTNFSGLYTKDNTQFHITRNGYVIDQVISGQLWTRNSNNAEYFDFLFDNSGLNIRHKPSDGGGGSNTFGDSTWTSKYSLTPDLLSISGSLTLSGNLRLVGPGKGSIVWDNDSATAYIGSGTFEVGLPSSKIYMQSKTSGTAIYQGMYLNHVSSGSTGPTNHTCCATYSMQVQNSVGSAAYGMIASCRQAEGGSAPYGFFGGLFEATSQGSFSETVPLLAGGVFEGSAMFTTVTEVIGGKFRIYADASSTITSGYGCKIDAVYAGDGMASILNYHGIYVANCVYDVAAGDNVANAITIEDQSTAGWGSESPTRGNIYLQGGNYNNGHLQLNTGHIWAESGLISFSQGAPTSSSDYDFAVGSGSLISKVPLNMSSQRINSLANPTLAQDAATKNYVDGQLRMETRVIASPSSSVNMTFFYANKNITVTKVAGVLVGGSSPVCSGNIKWATTRNSGSPTKLWTTDTAFNSTVSGNIITSFTNTAIPAGSWVWFTTSSSSGSPTELAVSLFYSE